MVGPSLCSSDTYDLLASFMERAYSVVDGTRTPSALPPRLEETGLLPTPTPPGRGGFIDRDPSRMLDQLGVPSAPSVGARVRSALIRDNWASLLANANDAEDLWGNELVELLNRPYRPILPLPSLGEIASALDGFVDQCEYPGWARSASFHICTRLRGQILRRIPGYYDGPWCSYQRPAPVQQDPVPAGR